MAHIRLDNYIKGKTLIVYDKCSHICRALTDEEHHDFMDNLSILCSDKKSIKIYRGTSKLRKQYNTDTNDMSQLCDIIFMIGEKSFYFWNDNHIKYKFVNSAWEDEVAKRGIVDFLWFQLHEKVCSLNFKCPRTKHKVGKFLYRDLTFFRFFNDEHNEFKFKNCLGELNQHDWYIVQGYYCSLLHTIGKSAIGESYFLSSSVDVRVAEHFRNNGIIICGWLPRKGLKERKLSYYNMLNPNESFIRSLGLPTWRTAVYEEQKEFCLKCGILPHYMVGLCHKDIFYVNPSFIKETIDDNTILTGLNVNQKPFQDYLKKTNYGRSYILCDGLYIDLLDILP